MPNLALELLSHRDQWVNAGINFVGFLVGEQFLQCNPASPGSLMGPYP